MKWLLYSCFYFSMLSTAAAQTANYPIEATTRIEREKINVELAINFAEYNSLSMSIEKEFQWNRWYFGPRVEILNPFQAQEYVVDYFGKDSVMQANWFVRVRPLQLEWQASPFIRIGIAPVWMSGPVPRRGYYQTPSSIYANFWLDKSKTLQLECCLQNADRQPIQISLRKRL